MVPTTVSPQASTALTASAVVQCSKTIFSFGNFVWIAFKVGKKLDSAFMMVMFFLWSLAHSPWMF